MFGKSYLSEPSSKVAKTPAAQLSKAGPPPGKRTAAAANSASSAAAMPVVAEELPIDLVVAKLLATVARDNAVL